jgi:hypothetical protein
VDAKNRLIKTDTHKLVRLIGTRHADFIRASGYRHRAQRPDT